MAKETTEKEVQRTEIERNNSKTELSIDIETGLPVQYEYTTSYNGLQKNIVPKDKYFYNIEGITNKKGAFICNEIVIKSISVDTENEKTYLELQTYDENINEDLEDPTKTFIIDISDLNTQKGYGILTTHGMLGTLNNIYTYLQDLIKADNVCKRIGKHTIERISGASKYGFVRDKYGKLDFNNFVGLDSKIMCSTDFNSVDNVIMKKGGTLEGQKKFIKRFFDDAVDDQCRHIMRAAYAVGVIGILKQIIGSDLPLGNYCVTGESGTGKSFFSSAIVSVWGNPINENGIRFSSGSSAAGLKPIRSHLNVIPSIIDDVEDLVKKQNGIQNLEQLAYGLTNGQNDVKATNTGSARNDNFSWYAPCWMNGESNSFTSIDIDGSGNRVWILHTNKNKGERIIKSQFSDFSDINDNYGWIGPAFVDKIREYVKTHDVRKEFSRIAETYYHDAYVPFDKKAKIAAALEYAFNLLVKFDLMQEGTPLMTRDEILSTFSAEDTGTSTEMIYNQFVDNVFTDTMEYPNKNDKMTQDDYDELKLKGLKVKGKIFIENNQYKLFMPPDVYNEEIRRITNDLGFKTAIVDVKTWVNKGWAEANSQGKFKWVTTNITYQSDKDDPIRSKKERCYKLILGEVDEEFKTPIYVPTNPDVKLNEEVQDRANQLKDKWIREGYSEREIQEALDVKAEAKYLKKPTDGFMTIPATKY
jgi:hypothetical protein